jgi:NTE family protein
VDVATCVLTSVLVDRMAQDVRALDRVNRLLASGARDPQYRRVPYLFVAPDRPDTIGRIADEVLCARYRGFPSPSTYDYTVLTRLLGGAGASHGELMSFLLFDPDFIEALVDAGQRDAAAAVHGGGPDDLFRLTRRAVPEAPRPAPRPRGG